METKPKRAPRKPKANPLLDSAGRPKLPYDPKINRWTGKPHEDKREIARRERRA